MRITKKIIIIKLVIALTAVYTSFIYANAEEHAAQQPSACLYYAQKNNVSKLCFPDQTNSLVYAIPRHALPKKMSEIKYRFGKLIWIPGNQKIIAFGMEPYKAYSENILSTWDGTKLNQIKLEKYQTATSSGYVDKAGNVSLGFSDIYANDFMISPDGTQIAWNINRLEKQIYDDRGRVSFTSHDVKIASLNGQNIRTALSEQITVIGGELESRQLLYWSMINPERIFLTKYFEGDLNSGLQGLYSLNIKNRQTNTIYNDRREVLSFSNDERMVTWTPDDETCCAGSDYTNNIVNILDFQSGKSRTIYDEWKEFKNIDKDTKGGEDHYPINALFSPSNDLIAISIAGNEYLASIRKVDTGKEISKIKNSRLIGWIDNGHLLIGKGYKYAHDEDPKYPAISIYDVKSGKEQILPLKNIVVIGIETY